MENVLKCCTEGARCEQQVLISHLSLQSHRSYFLLQRQQTGAEGVMLNVAGCELHFITKSNPQIHKLSDLPTLLVFLYFKSISQLSCCVVSPGTLSNLNMNISIHVVRSSMQHDPNAQSTHYSLFSPQPGNPTTSLR